MSRSPKDRDNTETDSMVPTVRPAPRAMMDDDRPTEIYARAPEPEVVYSRDQLIAGSTIREMMNSSEHRLSSALNQLLRRARADLPGADVDARTSLRLRHDFEFEKRVGYRLELKVFDGAGKCVEVVAELDQDGRAIRRGSVFSKLIPI